MEIAADEVKAVAEALADDLGYDKWSKPVALGDGRTVEARMVSDVDSDLKEDGDWYGKIEWDRGGMERGGRPDGFDGGAVVVYVDGRSRLWLQPPADVTGESRDSLIRRVKDYYNRHWWYTVVQVRVTDTPCPCCDNKAVHHESLGRVESDSGKDYFAEIIADMIHETKPTPITKG